MLLSVSSTKHMLRSTIVAIGQWAVWLHFDRRLYDEIKSGPAFADWPDALTYLKQAAGCDESIIITPLWGEGSVLLHFEAEEDAKAFFKRVPDGSLLGAELYDPTGEFQEDNT